MSEKRADTLLILNSCEGVLQVVLADRRAPDAPWRMLRAEERPAASQGAEILAPLLDEMFAAQGLPLTALSHVAATRGPGGFTGVRLSLATAAGLARAVGACQAGLDYLPLLAASAALRLGLAHSGPASLKTNALPGPELWVATHARRNLVQAQAFTLPDKADKGALPQCLTDILVLSPEELTARMAGQAHTAVAGRVLLGSGLERNRQIFADALAKESFLVADAAAAYADVPPGTVLLAGDAFSRPLPEALLRLASIAVFSDQDIVPVYARPSDAEQNLGHIAANLGLDPAAAEKKLAELTGRGN